MRHAALLATLMMACGKDQPAPAEPAAAVTPAAAVAPAEVATAPPDVAAAAPDAAEATAAGPDVAAGDATAEEVPTPKPAAKEIALTFAVAREWGRWVAVGCWIVQDRTSPWDAEGNARWETGRECASRVAVGTRLRGLRVPGDVRVTRIDGDIIEAPARGDFAFIAPDDDPRLARVAPADADFPASFAERAAAAPASTPVGSTADASDAGASDASAVDAGASDAAATNDTPTDDTPATLDASASTADATLSDAGPTAPTPPTAPATRVFVRGYGAPDEPEAKFLTRAVKRINGTDYPDADILMGAAVFDDLNGDGKVDGLVAASSSDTTGEGHAAGGGLWLVDGRNPGRFFEFVTDGQMGSAEVLAVSDLDNDLRKELLLHVSCPTGDIFTLARLDAEAPDGVGTRTRTTLDAIGSVEAPDTQCNGFTSTIDSPSPLRLLPFAAPDLAALAKPLGFELGATRTAISERLAQPPADGPAVEGLSLAWGLDDHLSSLSVDLFGARSLADRLPLAGLDVLLALDLKELTTALRPTLGKYRVGNTKHLTYEGPLDGGAALVVMFGCGDEQPACDNVAIARYTPRPALPARMTFLGLSRRSKAADVAKALGGTPVVVDGKDTFAGGGIVATYDADELLTELTVDAAAVPTLKKPGLFSQLGRPAGALKTVLGEPDVDADAGNPLLIWDVPTPEVTLYRLSATCDASACTRMTIDFQPD